MSLSQAQIAIIDSLIAQGQKTSKCDAAHAAACRAFLIEKAEVHMAASEAGSSHKASGVMSATVARTEAGNVAVRVNAFRPTSGIGLMFGDVFKLA